jgi:superkiller protein 3
MAMMQDGEYELARDAFIEVASVESNNATAFYNLGVAYWRLGDHNSAREALQRAVDLSEDSSRPLEMLACVLLDSNQAAAAGGVLANIKEQTPYSLTLTALAAYKAGSSDLAKDYLNKALKLDPDYAPALYNYAVLYRDNDKDNRKALDYYKRFQKAAPDNMRTELTPQEFIAIKTVITTPTTAGFQQPSPPHTDVTTDTEPRSSTTHGNHATHTSPSSPRTNTKPDKNSSNVVNSAEEAEKMLARVEVELVNDNADTALIMLKDIVRKYPDSADAIWALAQLYDKNLGNRKKAIEFYKKFATLFPNDPRAAKIRKRLSLSNRHRTNRSSAPPRNSKTAEEYFRKGLAAHNANKIDDAIAYYRKALKINKRSSLIAYNLGLAYKAKGDLDNAAKAFMLALQIQSDKTEALYMLGLTERDRGHTDAALVHLNRLLRLDPDYALAHYLLGIVYLDAKRPDMTKKHFERFIELSPNDGKAKQAKTWLKTHGGA